AKLSGIRSRPSLVSVHVLRFEAVSRAIELTLPRRLRRNSQSGGARKPMTTDCRPCKCGMTKQLKFSTPKELASGQRPSLQFQFSCSFHTMLTSDAYPRCGTTEAHRESADVTESRVRRLGFLDCKLSRKQRTKGRKLGFLPSSIMG